IFTAATLATNGSFSTFDFYRNSQGKFIYFFQRNNIAVNFSNGNANLNTNVNAYQGLVQFTPAINYRHTTSWTGVTNKSWFSASNWSNGIPTDSSTVIIPAGAANYPNSDADFYNYSTNQYPKCGTLHVNAGVADYPLSVGVTVEGLIKNNGNMTWNYDPGYYGGSFSIWGSNNYFLGNGTITYKTGDGAGYNFVRTGNNKIIINLNAPTYTLRPTNCLAVKDFQIVRGNVDWSSTTESELYVDNSILFTPPARFLNGFIQHRIMPNVPIQMPLGNAPNLQPASITLFNTTSENYLKSSFTTTITGAAPNPATCIVNAQGISSILNGGFWTINAATPLEIGAYYNANFKLKGSTNSISADRYALLKRNNASANWQVAGTYQAAKDSAGYVVSSAVNINSFSDFAIGIADGILPLQFLFFSAQKCTANQVCLHWRTANEQNVSHFEIERSVDGKTFNKIGSTNANNQASNSYTSKDDITLLQNIGFVYYRIKQIDIDGKFTFSDVRTIKLSTKNELSIYPNPSNAIVNIDGWYKVKNIVLYDINGRKLQQWNTSLSAIDISSFARGNYILIMVLATGEVLQQKLVKQ
ncbi:MAG: T9SS type A sorting domain-containing protein, partial [Ferruginibacter sp.]